MTVTLKPALEAELAALAKSKGLSLDEFVNRVLERFVAYKKPAAELSAEERARILD
jgi:predicted HicB family RNase H-like nuclease